jgi:AcrR family transcriptional regulator
MKARSTLLTEHRRARVTAKPARRRSAATPRLPHAMRRAQILSQAAGFFSTYGLTAQTRALAEVCGISQRLLYRFFPNKAALIEEVYKAEIAGPFKALWFAELADRSRPVEERLIVFYRQYYDQVLTERWLRLFLYASLANVAMAPAYISAIVNHMLEVIVAEAAHELRLELPPDKALGHELGWALHGAVSHLAIRRWIYRNTNHPPAAAVIPLYVRLFLSGLEDALGTRPVGSAAKSSLDD